MRLGKALVGVIIGAAIGIALLFAIVRFSDSFWSAIPFAIITGFGVRMAVGSGARASYFRGALTAVLTLAAYIGGFMLVTYVATSRANAPAAKPAVLSQASEGGTDAGGKDVSGQPATPAPEANVPVSRSDFHRGPMVGSSQFSTWSFIWLAIAAFIGYELGRGSDASSPTYAEPMIAQPAAVGTHPDA
jgi:hypothetical protein